ncbi:MAG: threonine/serine dehydratase [Proteobacteria bacterium]|nr:threonine/serine dehydratase [Pseudomonadota bacterium]MBU1610921.1 threonine/serine dehydratase [Pseudomonadota bacterium]
MTVTPDAIRAAWTRIRPHIRHTPLEPSLWLSRHTGAEVLLKLETQQVTGSFKPRGGFNVLLTLTGAQKKRGIVAPTAGNHGISLAYAAGQVGIPVRIYLPQNTDPAKIERLEAYGAQVEQREDFKAAHRAALRASDELGMTFVSAYNHPAMIAGGGTVALEILKDCPEVDTVVVGMGGGGLAAGLGILLKSSNPSIQIWGVQMANSPTFGHWLAAGKPVPVTLQPSMAAGLSGYVEEDTLTFPLLQAHLDRVVTISEEELAASMAWLLDREQQLTEPSGAAAAAALLQLGPECRGRTIAALLTGRNIGLDSLLSLVGK